MSMTTDGILLLAFGNPCYGYAAYNMVKSIKLNGCSLPVMLIHDGKQRIDLSAFDITEQIEVSESAGYTKTECYFRSRFANTLFLDVDGIAFKDITPLYEQWKNSNTPYAHYIHKLYTDADDDYPEMFWATKDVIKKYYGNVVANLPATQSSIQFYRKCKEADKLYGRVLELLKSPIPVSEMRNLWGGGQPDELYLNIALAEQGLSNIHYIPKEAMFFGNRLSPLTLTQIQERYYFLSIFGGRNFTRPVYQEYYDKYMVRLMRKHGQEHRYKIPLIMQKKHADMNRHMITQRGRESARLHSSGDVNNTSSNNNNQNNNQNNKQNNNQNTNKSNEQTNQYIRAVNRNQYKPPASTHRSHKLRYSVSPEKVHLITTYYQTKTRQHELDYCLEHNIKNSEIDYITVFSGCDVPFEADKLTVIRTDNRVTFNQCVRQCKPMINIISNSDIYFENVNDIKQLDFSKHFAITRHDLKGKRIVYRSFAGSQDVWIGKDIQELERDVAFGYPRCDQIIAYELSKQKRVLNPARQIKCIHVHTLPERSYTMKDELSGKGLMVSDIGSGGNAGAFRPRMLIHQPGRYGDLLIILPIAKYYYDAGYLVDILCPHQYHDLFDNIDYATPVTRKDMSYAKYIDLSFGLTNGEVNYWWRRNMHRFESFVDAKYELAGVPYPQPLVWNRNIDKEQSLKEKLNRNGYVLIHEDYNIRLPVDGLRIKVEDGYNIFDWYQVIMEAKEIHCIDSGVSNFIRYLNIDKPKYIYEGRNGGGVMMSKYEGWEKIHLIKSEEKAFNDSKETNKTITGTNTISNLTDKIKNVTL